MSEENRCPECGAPLPARTPQGLCPGCLLKRGVETTPPASDAGQASGDFTPPTPEQLAAQFPDLEILEFIGRGGMGMVYKARQKHLGRLVALKILLPKIARDPAFAERFAREARAMAMLSHPHIVAVYDFGQKEDLYYFLMEFVDGLTLRQLLDAGKLAPREAVTIVPQICEALQFAHDKGVVHRDIKPENILMDRSGQVKIADFGLAKLVGQEANDFSLTGAGQVMGTPHYMAPEQLEHPQEVDHRADIYSLGVVFYQMLTGELPIGRFAAPSKKVHIDVRLDEVVLRALEKEPELRYQHASDVKTQIEAITASAAVSPVSDVPLGPPRGTAADSKNGEPGFSRLAIAGAAWAPLFFVMMILAFFASAPVQTSAGSKPPGPQWWQWILIFTVLPSGVFAPFSTTILGAVAMAQIRHSAGRLYGLALAIFDSLLFPLLLLDFLIGMAWCMLRDVLLWHSNPIPPDVSSLAVVVLTLVISIAIDFLIVRWAWHAANKPVGGAVPANVPSPAPPAIPAGTDVSTRRKESQIFGWLALGVFIGGLALAALIGGLGNGGGARDAEATIAILSLPMSLVFGILGRRHIAGKVALWCFGVVVSLLLVAFVAFFSRRTMVSKLGERAVSVEAPVAAAPAATQKLTFGPVIERTLSNPTESLTNCFIDLDSGNQMTLPDSLKLKLDTPIDFPNEAAFLAWKGAHQATPGEYQQDLLAWTEEHHADAVARVIVTDGKLARYGLRTFCGIMTEAIANDKVENITPDEAHEKGACWASEHGIWLQVQDLLVDSGKTASFLFETAAGRIGILHIAGYSEKLHGVKIRYKLVQDATTPLVTPAAAQKLSFGPMNSSEESLPPARRRTIDKLVRDFPEDQATHARLARAAGMVRSRVLCKEILHLMADALHDPQNAGEKSPADAKDPEFLVRRVQELEELDPGLLVVAPEQERQFAEGSLDASTTKAVEQMVQVLKDSGVHLPALSQYLIDEFRAGKLRGVRLEVARRILATYLVGIVDEVGRTPPTVEPAAGGGADATKPPPVTAEAKAPATAADAGEKATTASQSLAPGRGTPRLQFRLKRPEDDTTSPVDEFANTFLPKDRIRLLKPVLLDESAVVDASYDPSPGNANPQPPLGAPEIHIFFSKAGAEAFAKIPSSVERFPGGVQIEQRRLFVVLDGKFMEVNRFRSKEGPPSSAVMMILPPASRADGEKVVRTIKAMVGRALTPRTFRAPAEVLGDLPADALPKPSGGWDEFTKPKADKWLDENITLRGDMIQLDTVIKHVELERIPVDDHPNETLRWDVQLILEDIPFELHGCKARLKLDSYQDSKAKFIRIMDPRSVVTLMGDETLARRAKTFKAGDRLTLRGTISKAAVEAMNPDGLWLLLSEPTVATGPGVDAVPKSLKTKSKG